MKNYNGYEVLLFIKTMMAQERVNQVALIDVNYAYKYGILCEKAMVDDSYSRSVDRNEILSLLEELDKGEFQVLVVEDIYDITYNPEDLRNMIDRINEMKIIIFDLSIMNVRTNNYDEEC